MPLSRKAVIERAEPALRGAVKALADRVDSELVKPAKDNQPIPTSGFCVDVSKEHPDTVYHVKQVFEAKGWRVLASTGLRHRKELIFK